MELQEKKKGLGLMVRDSDILGPTRPGCLITLSSVGSSVVNSEPRSANVSSYLNSVMELVGQWDLQPTNRKRAAKGGRYLKLSSWRKTCWCLMIRFIWTLLSNSDPVVYLQIHRVWAGLACVGLTSTLGFPIINQAGENLGWQNEHPWTTGKALCAGLSCYLGTDDFLDSLCH